MRTLESYSALDRTYVEVIEPTTVDELHAALVAAAQAGRSVTVRCGGHAFDSQSLNDDLVIDVCHLDTIGSVEVNPTIQPQVTLQPGVLWGQVVRQLAPGGLMPHVVVTSSRASVGGTLASNSISRCSPFFGKEGAHVKRVSLLSPSGDVLECGPDTRPDLFAAVVGGLGYLGVITSATYELLRIPTPAQVVTEIHRYTGLDAILSGFDAASDNTTGWDAAYAIVFDTNTRKTRWRGFVTQSKYSNHTSYGGMLLYDSRPFVRVPLQFALSFGSVNTLALNVAFDAMRKRQLYADDLFGYTFFMDGHTDVKHLFDRGGLQFRTCQQTFVLPRAAVPEFIESAAELMLRSGVSPTMLDLLKIPQDDFLLSATRRMGGIAVSLAFDRLSESQTSTIVKLLLELSSRCGDLGGRIHLVKNVIASRDDLRLMYGEAARRFLELKQELDPSRTLRNSFFDRVIASAAA